jgi:hypothetical protein
MLIQPRHLSLAMMLVILVGAKAGASTEPARELDSPFVVVFIDAKTEKALGPFPYDRSVLAKAIDKAAASGAKGVVLKFFIDKPRTEQGDRALVQSMKGMKVVLQARLDDEEPKPNPLPEQFRLPGSIATAGNPLSGKSGWIPLRPLSAAAYDVGFIDYRVIDRMPLVERYGESLVKSLYLCCLELALGQRAEVIPGKSVRLGGKTVTLDARSEVGIEYPAKDEQPFISFSDFLGPQARPEVKDRVMILAYDSERFEPVETPMGKIRPHRAFVYALTSIYRQFR